MVSDAMKYSKAFEQYYARHQPDQNYKHALYKAWQAGRRQPSPNRGVHNTMWIPNRSYLR